MGIDLINIKSSERSQTEENELYDSIYIKYQRVQTNLLIRSYESEYL